MTRIDDDKRAELLAAELELRESEARYRRIVETSRVGFGELDASGRIIAVNPHMAEMFGYAHGEMAGLSVVEALLFPEDRTGWLERRQALMQGESASYDQRFRSGSGDAIWLIVSATPITNASGVVSGAFAMMTDITDRKRAEEALQDAKSLVDAVVDNVPLTIFLKGATDQRFVLFNRAGEDLLGCDRSALLGKNNLDLFPPEQAVRFMSEDREVLDGEAGVLDIPEEPVLTAKNGLRWLHTRKVCLRGPDGAKYLLGISEDITERKRTDEALRQSEARLDQAQALANIGSWETALANIGSWETDLPSLKVTWSKVLYRIFDLDPATFDPTHAGFLSFVHPEDRAAVDVAFVSSFSSSSLNEIEHRIVSGSGLVKFILERWRVVHDDQGRPVRAIGTCQEITERRQAEEERAKLEAQLHQAQKMESIGQLAGGVAHDFNNMLGVILGHAEMALEQLDPASPLHEQLEEIRRAARRSADLTQQLMAFARRQTVAPKVLDLNDTVVGILTMLGRLIGEDIRLAWQPAAGLWSLKVDPGQLDQVLTNLCVNARDAISGVGNLTIETRNVTLDEEYCAANVGAVPGDYVRLAVTDDGCGMDKETQQHLFEPFFTTKEVGKGTGLGLATVYGIVKQNNGFIDCHSEPGHGTTFKLYLPRHQDTPVPVRTDVETTPSVRGHETILLVDDEAAILVLTKRLLEGMGYTVLTAGTPGDAIRLAERHSGEIHLLLTDVVMPEMNGRDLAKNLLSRHPGLKRMFMSGYTADIIADHGVLDEGVNFIQKPFSKRDLAAKVREALDGERSD